MKTTRRDFLKLAGFGSVAAALGASAYRVKGWFGQKPAPEYEVLSKKEVEIVEAMADAMFPGEPYEDHLPNGKDSPILDHLDWYLDSVDEKSSGLFRMLIHLINDFPLLSGQSQFKDQSRAERIEILRAWDKSSIMYRRKGFKAIKLALSAGYFQSEEVLDAAGIEYPCV